MRLRSAWREFLAWLARPGAPPATWRDFLLATGADPRTPGSLLAAQRDRVLELAAIQPGNQVLEAGCGLGLLAFRAAELAGQHGSVVGCDPNAACIAWCRRQADRRAVAVPRFVCADARALPFPSATFDAAVLRCVLAFVPQKRLLLEELRRVLRPGGRLALYERINRANTRLCDLLAPGSLAPELLAAARRAEAATQHDPGDPMLDFDAARLVQELAAAGFGGVQCEGVERTEEHRLTPGAVRAWLESRPAPGRPPYRELLARYLLASHLAALKQALVRQADGRLIRFTIAGVYLHARALSSVQARHDGGSHVRADAIDSGTSGA